MAFGSLVPGMAPMPDPEIQPNQLLKQGMAIMQQARNAQQRPGAPPGTGGLPQSGQPPQGLLQRLLNPAAPVPGAPMNLAAPGMTPNGAVPGPGGPMQMGLLAKLFPGMMGQQQQPSPPMPGMDPGGVMPQVPPNALGGLY